VSVEVDDSGRLPLAAAIEKDGLMVSLGCGCGGGFVGDYFYAEVVVGVKGFDLVLDDSVPLVLHGGIGRDKYKCRRAYGNEAILWCIRGVPRF
jgi:hypothetical protein